MADLETVKVCRGLEVVASHARSWDAGKSVEDPRHIATLVEHKRSARAHRGLDRLRHATTNAERFMQRAAELGRNLGSITAKLLELLDQHGAAALDDALHEVLERDVIHVPSVRQVLEQRRHAAGRPLLSTVDITDQKLLDVVVRPHDLSIYDRLDEGGDDDQDDG